MSDEYGLGPGGHEHYAYVDAPPAAEMYAWSVPRTWVAGEVVSASIMNAHVRDQLNAIATGIITPVPTAASIAALNALYGGAPVNGAKGMLVAAGPVENVYLLLTYNSTLGKWVSGEIGGGGDQATNPGLTGSGINANGAGAAGTSPTVATSWAPANAGMTFQVKGYGQITGTGNPYTTFVDVYTLWTFSGGQSGGSVNIGSGLQNTTTNVRISWTNVGNPGAYELISIGIQVRNDGNPGNGTVFYARAIGRWVG